MCFLLILFLMREIIITMTDFITFNIILYNFKKPYTQKTYLYIYMYIILPQSTNI